MTTGKGGIREGAGRPKGSTKISSELQEAFREHTATAVQAVVAIAEDKAHAQHLKACELILNRAYGTSPPTNEADSIVELFMNEEITAIKAGLLLESRGLKVGALLQKYINRELRIVEEKNGLSLGVPEPLPRN